MTQLLNTTLFSDANLVSYYKLESTSDSKGANTLTNHNTVAFNPAKYNNGADFGSTNTNKYLNTGNNLGIAGNGAISLIGWIKIYENTTDGIFFVHESTTSVNRNIAIKKDGGGSLSYIGSGVAATYAFSDTTHFHHVAITRDGSSNHLGYLDGVQVVSFAGSSGAGNSLNDFQIGTYTSTSEYANVIVDDVAIFSRVLTAAEINLIANTGGFTLLL